jgi:excisionase family DNA binding protein
VSRTKALDRREGAGGVHGPEKASRPFPANQAKNAVKVGRLALSKAEAAESLGVSVDYFEEHVMPELRIVRRGRRRLIPVAELERWLDRSAARTLEDR